MWVDQASERRVVTLTLLASAAFFILVLRLFTLQVLRGDEMERLAELNRTQIIPIRAPRGFVRDRNGEILLDNAPRFSLLASVQSVPREGFLKLEEDLIETFPQWKELIRRKMSEARHTGKMTPILSDLDRQAALALIERRTTLPGAHVIIEPRRRARFGVLASHVMGYVDEISAQELKSLKEEGYRMGQLIGKTGVEKIFDEYLRGQDGGLQFEMDAGGHHVGILRQIPTQRGYDVYLTIDRTIQEALEEGLRNSPSGRGAGVVMDPRTGAVLAMASAPDFDPTGSRVSVLSDPQLPLFNRAVQGRGYPPGSVFKIITAAAVLKQNVWNIHKQILCTGSYRLGTRDFGCWKKHGYLDFIGAMAWSCDVYYYNMALRIGPDPIEQMAREFGLGRKTGIELPSETSGLIPGRAWKKSKGSAWYDGDTLNYCIGQGFVLTTPLQLARMMCAVALRGPVWQPHVLDRIIDDTGQVILKQEPVLRSRVDLPPDIWDTVQRGVMEVVKAGSGRGVWRQDLVIGAKTGTAQNPHGEDHAWFAAYAGKPGEEASLAVVVFVENGGQGSAAAGPVARAVITAAFPPPAPAGVPIAPAVPAAPLPASPGLAPAPLRGN